MTTPSPESGGKNPPAARHLLWKARPVFLSSTFRDMHADRDFLRTHAFPDLEERLLQRAHYLETIDLRQGVETAEIGAEGERELKVLKVCLDEITRSRPFFVGLLGDRYGWVPPAERMLDAARRAGFDRDVAGHSVTELEILYGVLDNAEQRRRSWFYLREMDYTGMPPEKRKEFDERAIRDDPGTSPEQRAAAADRLARLEALKERIRRELPGRVRTYRVRWDRPEEGLDQLNRMVVADLWSDLEPETAESLRTAPRTWQEADRRVLDDFVAGRLRSYVERPAVTERLLDHVLTPAGADVPWGLAVAGESGAGKSCLFARVYQELDGRPDVLLLAHAAGISVGAGRVDRMLRRWIGVLAEFLGVPDPIPEEDPAGSAAPERRGLEAAPEKPLSERIDEAFASLLGQAAGRTRVVVLVDALNQFEPTVRAQHLTWLPKLWPENARLLATAIPGPAAAALAGRVGAVEYALPPAGRDEAAEMARSYFQQRHHREVNRRALDVLLEKRLPGDGRPAHGNPLWLALALQEMNLLEADDFERADRQFAHLPGAERMEALQVEQAERLPADVPGVYGRLLERAERDFGRAWTRALADLIALGRAGWRESDLRALAPAVSGVEWKDLAFAGVRRALGSHLVQRGAEAQWDFFHAQLREAVLARNLPEPAHRQVLHGQVADHLESLPGGDPLRTGETMFHLVGLADRARAARHLAGLEIGSAGRAGAAATLGGMIETRQMAGDGAPMVDWTCDCLATSGSTVDRIGAVAQFFAFDLSDTLKVRQAAEEPRGRILEAVRGALEAAVGRGAASLTMARDLSVSYSKLGDLHRGLGHGAEAMAFYQKALELREELRVRIRESADCARDLADSYEKLGDLHRGLGHGPEAMAFYQKALELSEELRARNPQSAVFARDLSISYSKLGDLHRGLGHGAEAMAFHQKALELREELRARDPQSAQFARDLSISYSKVGDLHLGLGHGAEAMAFHQKALELREELRARDPQSAVFACDLSISYSKVGDLHLGLGHGAEAMAFYKKDLAIAEELRARNPQSAVFAHDLAVSYERLGDLHRGLGHGAEAMTFHQKALELSEELRARNPQSADFARDLAVSYERLGDLHRDLGHGAEAMAFHQKALELREELRARNPRSADFARDLAVSYEKLGDLHRGLGHGAEAMAFSQKALELREELRARNPRSADFARDLSVSYSKLGDLHRGLGHGAEAMAFFQKALELSEELRARNPQSAQFARDLSVSYHMLGDLHLDLGHGAEAMAFYQKALQLSEELRARNPQNADFARDLAVSYYKMAMFAGQQQDEAGFIENLRKCFAVLDGMRRRGMHFDSQITQLYEQLARMFGGR